MRVGILTGGGDCPGLNAVIRAVVRSASLTPGERIEVLGIEDGFDGLVEDRRIRPLAANDVRGILNRGGTILGTTNRGNPFEYPMAEPDGTHKTVDVSGRCIDRLREYGMDGLVVIGGDGTLRIAHDLAKLGTQVVGVPKTIDNDLSATDQTFGFDTAVQVAVEALDRLKTTAESHDRMMVMEVMGRYAGWIALHAGLAGGAHVILIPEIPYRFEEIAAHIRKRRAYRANHHLVVVAEGARPVGGDYRYDTDIVASPGQLRRLGGAASEVAAGIKGLGIETRTLVLGHLQRGGTPTYRDRMLGTAFGARALELCRDGAWNRMVCLRGTHVEDVPLADAVAQPHLVSPDDEMVRFARDIGICLG